MRKCYFNHVVPAPYAETDGCSRVGTVVADKDRLIALLGQPHRTYDNEIEWVFRTPRGPVTIHTYWWNVREEFSIGARRADAARWLAGFMRACGFYAKTNIFNGDIWTKNMVQKLEMERTL